MHSTSVYSLKLSVLEGAGAKALATDHRARSLLWSSQLFSMISRFDSTAGAVSCNLLTVQFFRCHSNSFHCLQLPPS